MIRITLDTNQLVRALMRPPELATLMMSWQSNRFRVVASQELLDEYERVLLYPEIRPVCSIKATESAVRFVNPPVHATIVELVRRAEDLWWK